MNRKAVLISIFLLIWELCIYFISAQLADVAGSTFQLAARYSARTSFVILALLLGWVSWKGLHEIYQNELSRQNFVLFVLAFAWNHFLHFIYLYLNYHVNNLQLLAGKNLFGAVGYILLLAAPFYIWKRTELTRSLFIMLHGLFLLLLSINGFAYFNRIIKPISLSSPPLLYYFLLSTVVGLIGMIGFRLLRFR